MRYILSLLLVLGSTTLASAQDLAGAKKFFDQSHLPTVSSTAPTNGQVLTWDSTLGKAKWAAGGGGGGSFDPAAATAITFTTGLTTPITGPTDTPLVIQSGVNGSGIARSLDLFGANGGAATKSGADVNLHAGSGNTSGSGGGINITTGNGGNTSGSGGDIYLTCGSGGGTAGGGWQYFYTGDGGSTSNASGSFYFSTGGVTDGNSGDFEVNLSDAYGTNRNGGVFKVQLAAGSGSGENGSFYLRGSGGATIFKVAYDGTVTGPADTTFNILAATPASSNGNNLTLRASAATSTNGDGGEVKLYSGNATGSSEFIGGGVIALFAGNGGATSVGGSITRQTGNGGSTSGASGSITDTIGSTTDGNVGSWAVVMPSATGTNRSGGVASFKIGAKTGSGTDGYFTIKNASDANLFKVAYDGTITGPGTLEVGTVSALSGAANLTLTSTGYGQIYLIGGTQVASFLKIRSTSRIDFDSDDYGSSDFSLTRTATGVLTSTGAIKVPASGGIIVGTPTISSGSATPEGAITAGPGSVYLRTGGGAGTGFYVKESGTGNTGWVAK